jgi:hypothetical protein
MAMMAMTTSNSIKVKAAFATRLESFIFIGYRHWASDKGNCKAPFCQK